MGSRPNDDRKEQGRLWLSEGNPIRVFIDSAEFDNFLKSNKHVVSATTASLLSTFIGYPLDSLKSRLQASRAPITVPRLAANIFREEGIVGFYRGLWIPLVTISAVRAASFTIYNNTKSKLHDQYGWSREKLLSVGASGAVGGALAGCLISFGSVPFELVKVRRQLEYSIAAAKGIHIVKPPNTWEAVKDIVKGPTAGMGNPNNSPRGITALWTGMRLHLLRDTSGTALYFFEYDSMRHLLGRLPNSEQGPTPYWAPLPPSLIPFVCGSLAGVSSWAIIYPLDVVKTKTQQRALSGDVYRGPIETLKRLLRGPEHAPRTMVAGFARLYRGLGVSALRSVTTHGMLWTILDAVSGWIDHRAARRGLEVDP
ncbi:SubName: Full=Related to carnitine/acylcarnitine translocase {ECO:0000313/EMBL:CCA75557.1} [Serendipita indica DSM 11827]|uniref:Related to carnitine/acylcarnitine translocase n=1 Tax=Serendipita indica (strain DSM 11827) TaxID=1109443 RepID=G4TW64_SERID|nr:SubName: Full=Related to carnitine/acylcarnitine translocase {ECO:0000313/EMBL:CCA75557.1} [Serendipita indica DSM 11827]CCA75557.1 related to carnitine/acylcarnitine translocase [Serendipita indica DSM 11827]